MAVVVVMVEVVGRNSLIYCSCVRGGGRSESEVVVKCCSYGEW
jgi:hypothetical protein